MIENHAEIVKEKRKEKESVIKRRKMKCHKHSSFLFL